MATTTKTIEIPETINTLFTKLEEQKTLLTNCSNLYQTLNTHFNNLQNSIDFKSQTLDSQFQTLDSQLTQTLDSLKTREDSFPDLLNSKSSNVTTQKTAGLSEISKPVPNESDPLSDILRSMCRRMDPGLLMRLLVEKRRETTSLREKMAEAFSECVDSERFVVEAVREFVVMKKEKRVGLIDTRWACSMVVRSMFPPDKLRETRRVFAKKAVERAGEVLREWKEVADCEGKEGVGDGTGMGPAEAAMFIEVLLGFGLMGMFEDGYYKKLMVEFCGRRDMAKLAVLIFRDNIADLIDELVKNGKEVEAVYFASESGLMERFQPVSLLKSFLQKTADKLKKRSISASATDKANSMESISLRSIIKCVEDHNLEEEFPVESLRKRLSVLEKVKYDRKKGPTPNQTKRPHPVSSRARNNGPTKTQRLHNPYTTFAGRDHISPAPLSPVSKYLGPYTYPTQPAYPSQTTYGGPYVPALATAADQTTQYGISGDGAQVGYASSYDYSASAPSYPH